MKFMPVEEFESINRRLSSLKTGDCTMVGKVEAYTLKATSDDKRLKTFLQSKYEDENITVEKQQSARALKKCGSRGVSTFPVPKGCDASSSSEVDRDACIVCRSPEYPEPYARRGSSSRSPRAIDIENNGAPLKDSVGLRPGPSAAANSFSSNASSCSRRTRYTAPDFSTSSLSPKTNSSHRKTLLYLLSTLNNMFGPDYDFSDVGPHYFVYIPSFDIVVKRVQVELERCLGERALGDLQFQLWSAIDEVVGLSDSECWQFTPDSSLEPEVEEGSVMWSFYYFFYNRKLKRVVLFACRALYLTSSSQEDDENQLQSPFPSLDLLDDKSDVPSENSNDQIGGFWTKKDYSRSPSVYLNESNAFL